MELLMPFQSEKQRRYLWANEPKIARDWTEKYGSRVKKQEGGGFNLDRYIYPKAHEQKYLTRNEWATDPNMYHNEIMNDYVTNVSKNLSEVPYAGNFLAAGAELGAPIASGIVSLPYDLRQAWDDWQTKDYNSIGDTFKGLLKSIDHQNPLDSVYYRTKGSLRPLGRRLENTWDAIKNEFGGSAQAAEMPINNNQSILPKARPRSLTEEEDEDNTQSWFSRYLNPRNIAQGVGSYIGNKISNFNPFTIGFNAMRGNMPYRGATGSAGGYSAAQLNKMNALGGYYSKPARQQRQIQQRGINVLNRAAKGKAVGNVNALLGKHGYTGTPGGGISFKGTPQGNPNAGSGYSRSDSGWDRSPFRKGGLASLWQR